MTKCESQPCPRVLLGVVCNLVYSREAAHPFCVGSGMVVCALHFVWHTLCPLSSAMQERFL